MGTRLALLIVSVLIGLGLVEGVVRARYVSPWYDVMASGEGAGYREKLVERYLTRGKLDYSLNSLKLRDRDYAHEKPDGVYRILVLGDSFTFGTGVEDDSAIFPERLEAALDREPPEGFDSVQVLNAGVAGSLTSEWASLWNIAGSQFDPDLLLVVFFLRDGTRTTSVKEFFWPIGVNIVDRNRSSFWYRHLYVYRVVRDNLDRKEIGERYTKKFYESYFGSAEQTVEWKIAQRNLRALAVSAAARGTRFAFAVFPVLVSLDDDYAFAEICDLLVDFGTDEGFATHDLREVFMGKDAQTLWVSTTNQHPNALGHSLAADSLLPFIRSVIDTDIPAKAPERD